MDEPARDAPCDVNPAAAPSRAVVLSGAAGLASLGLALWAVQGVQFKVVSYTAEFASYPVRYYPSLLFALILCVGIVIVALRAGWSSSHRFRASAGTLWPLLLCVPVVSFAFVEEPAFAPSFLLILGAGWAAFRGAVRWPEPKSSGGGHSLALAFLLALIAVLVVIHTRQQVRFFEHFMLGHADIGHFAEELKNVLAGRGLRCDSFDNTRLGWHFVPLMYVLVPGYALWPSPVYLMVCGAVVVHIVALPVYYLARRLSGSTFVGLMWGVSWLLLPSVSRLVYGNTYGFQWNNVTMPILALVIATGLMNRWRTCWVMIVLLLLCRETAAAAVVGWGLYVALFTVRRKTGVGMVLVAVVYFTVCVTILIPHFSAAGRYERLDLFGELGGSVGDVARAAFTQPGIFFARLVRSQGIYFVLMMLIPMAMLPVRGWRIAVAAIPTLVPLMLLENTDWMSIKFWHHATVLPFLFFAGVASMEVRSGIGDRRTSAQAEACGSGGRLMVWLSGCRSPSVAAMNRGIAVAVLVCAAWGHYLYGFSPVSKSYEPLAAAAFWNEADPRLETVRRLREAIPRNRTILATERLATHFTDYKRLYTGRAIRPVHYIIIDRADGWDLSGLVKRVPQFSRNEDYRLYGEFGSIVVFERRAEAPLVELG